MQRSRRKKDVFLRRMIVFSAVFLICLIIFGAIAAFVFISNKKAESEKTTTAQTTAKYIKPLNIFLIITDGTDSRNYSYNLMHVDFQKTRIPVTTLPPEAEIEADNRKDTLSGFMNYGGVMFLKSAVESEFKIKIDKYAVISMDNFSEFINRLGGLNYTIPQNLMYTDTSGKVSTSLESGLQNLNGNMVAQLLRYPNWSEGKIGQVRTTESVITALVNQYSVTQTLQNADDLYSFVINRMKTDISSYDYIDFKHSFEPFTKVKSPAVSVSLEGSYQLSDSKNVFVFDENAAKNITDNYK